jgi:predicted TIM-barrel fold metal-dependent hydrolase
VTAVEGHAAVYDTTLEEYIKVLDANGVSHAVLVQLSFLGTDNHYLLDVLRRYPRFRDIAVVQPTRLGWSASGST